MALRDSNSSQSSAKDLSEALSIWLNQLKVEELFRTCATCMHLKQERYCEVHKADPPASVIVRGCDQYKDYEEIPF